MLRFMFILCLALSSACGPVTPAASPSGHPDSPDPGDSASSDSPRGNAYAPRAGDSALTRAVFFLNIKDTGILTLESYPLQFTVSLKGSLPTGCHQARMVVNPPDADHKIVIEAYSVVNPNRVCAQMIQMFEGNISLGSFPKGHYSVWVNDEKIGEIDA